MDRMTLWRFLQTFAWAVKALHLEAKDLGWTPEELDWPDKILRGEKVKISGDCRILQDRFAVVFQDFFHSLLGEEYWKTQREVKETIFSDWKDWRRG